jgi:hypothetical protein
MSALLKQSNDFMQDFCFVLKWNVCLVDYRLFCNKVLTVTLEYNQECQLITNSHFLMSFHHHLIHNFLPPFPHVLDLHYAWNPHTHFALLETY